MKTALIIIGTLIVIFGGLFLMARYKMKNLPVVADHANIITLTDMNFDHQLKNKIVLVDFWASWCAPCKMMAPVLNDVAEELTGNANVGKVNVEEYQVLAQKYQIRNIPTMILFKNGKEVTRFVGVKNKEFLLQEINKAR
jgi:thioredoxin 1